MATAMLVGWVVVLVALVLAPFVLALLLAPPPKLRIAVVAELFLAPFTFLTGVGLIHVMDTGGEAAALIDTHLGGTRVAWLVGMFASTGLGYVLAWRWTRGNQILPPTDLPPPNYWTDRDKAAWEKVQAKAKSFEKVTTEQLADAQHYSELTLDLARQVAELYNPGAADPFDHLTIPEVMTCAELVAADMNELVQKYVPGVHMLRVRDYKRAKQAADWYRVGQNVYWAGAAVFNPVQVGLRWLASRYALGSLFERIQGNILLWFHTAFVHELGRYLIELNSGRLKVGVKRYREIMAAHQEPPIQTEPPPPAGTEGSTAAEPPAPAALPAAGPKPVEVAVLGAVKAGKSSLVNAILGQQSATVDTLPVPHVGIRYLVRTAEGAPLSVLDTAGFGQEGPNEAEFAAAAEAAKDADLILLVTPATSPGRKPDVDLLDRLKAWFAARPQLKLPPVVVVVNQVDLLSPKAEWSPPYDWFAGSRPKEVNIRECVSAVREQVGPRAAEVVPVCARQGETWGITDGLVPVVASHLDAARGSAMLKLFHAEGSADQFKKLGRQLVEGGKQVLDILRQSLKK
jgi:predicted GTPase